MFAIVHRVCHTVTTLESESDERRTEILKRYEDVPHSKSGTRRAAIQNISKRCGVAPHSKSGERLAAIQNRHETCRDSKAARGRAAIQYISKRCGVAPHSKKAVMPYRFGSGLA